MGSIPLNPTSVRVGAPEPGCLGGIAVFDGDARMASTHLPEQLARRNGIYEYEPPDISGLSLPRAFAP